MFIPIPYPSPSKVAHEKSYIENLGKYPDASTTAVRIPSKTPFPVGGYFYEEDSVSGHLGTAILGTYV